MAPRESQKRASLKWDRENMIVLSCKIRKEQAVAFKAHCENRGNTSNTVLKDFVMECIGEQETVSRPVGASTAHGSAGEVVLHQEALRMAQEAAQRAGETVPQFIERAVETQAKRDKTSLALGISPATGKNQEQET